MSDAPTHIKDLVPDPHNARKHNPRNVSMIADTMQAVGAARSIVIDEENKILAGNGAVEAAAEAGITKVQVVDVDGETLVAVRRRGLSDTQKTRLALADNRTTDLSEFDPDVLREIRDDGFDLSPLFTDDEQKALLDADDAPITEMDVPRPAEMVWALLLIPMEDWPKHQAAVEAMQINARWSTVVVRPKTKNDPK